MGAVGGVGGGSFPLRLFPTGQTRGGKAGKGGVPPSDMPGTPPSPPLPPFASPIPKTFTVPQRVAPDRHHLLHLFRLASPTVGKMSLPHWKTPDRHRLHHLFRLTSPPVRKMSQHEKYQCLSRSGDCTAFPAFTCIRSVTSEKCIITKAAFHK